MFDCAVAALALVILSPVMLIVAMAVKLSSEGPILFRQKRMGRNGWAFEILKFRSMRESEPGPTVTKAGDARLTSIGGFLRRTKLDELPQLVNVLRGDMSLVGPRPKVPHHQTYTLRVRPGVTGAASLAFRDEENFLHQIPEHALDACQINLLMPLKRDLDDTYSARASFLSDLDVLFRTIFHSHKPADKERVFNLQVSLVSLSQALGQSVAPTPAGAKQAELISLMRNMAAK
jgi:lipopolysaccharide/colanic/teichoic acid biosynthesis glycosyltransferase